MRFTGFKLTMAKDLHPDDKKMIPLTVEAEAGLSPLHATVGKSISR